ncbi:MAG: uracil-DNA glycosylase [Deltaproteobacteria bacterium]|nr:uracil-DNA glycosylase [Candidatus Zymogenaceae bacterium]
MEYLSRSGVTHLPVKNGGGLSAPRVLDTPSPTGREASRSDDVTDRAFLLEAVQEELGDCRRCKLCEGRTNIVFGQGNPDAVLMFVGEGPGRDEDIQGIPFVGRAGQLLTKIIEAIDLAREDVYIGNIIKCRPPKNRDPEPDEVNACMPFLMKQIEAIHPQIICTLGAVATRNLLGIKTPVSKIRGSFQRLDRAGGVMVMPTFHPAYLLRDPSKKRDAWEDMKKVRDLYKTFI